MAPKQISPTKNNMKYPAKFLTPAGMNKSDTTNFIRAFPEEPGQAVAIFKHMKIVKKFLQSLGWKFQGSKSGDKPLRNGQKSEFFC
jgi:hypothetical protein